MASNTLERDVLTNFGGISVKCLNNLLENVKDLENSISIVAESPYIETKKVVDYLKPLKDTFSVLDLNIQSINAKFDTFKMLVDDLAQNGFEFSAICLQETWLNENMDSSFFNLDNSTTC